MTLKEIARAAHVSTTTASMVLNGKAQRYKISQAVADKVLNIAARHNYQPNFHARALLSQSTYLVGVAITGSLGYSFWGKILHGIETVLAPRNYHILLSSAISGVAQERQSIEFINSKGVDGLICNAIMEDDAFANADLLRQISQRKPVVNVGAAIESIASVYNDNAQGGEQVAAYLYGMGHRAIAYIGQLKNGPDERGAAFCRRLARHGCAVSVFANVEQFIQRATSYTAVFCYSDYGLMELYRVTDQLGITIPDQLSVVGYDNSQYTSFLRPKPTTVNQFKQEIGCAAAEKIMELLANPQAQSNVVFDPQLVEGHSVKRIA